MARVEVRSFFLTIDGACVHTAITITQQSLNNAYLYGKCSFNKFVLEDGKRKENAWKAYKKLET